MRNTILPFAVLVALVGCSVPAVEPVSLSTPFNAAEGAWSTASGNNTITGSALLRTRGGDVKTCAGFPVLLRPVMSYSTEIMSAQFGSTSSGFLPEYSAKRITPDPGYEELKRETTCDAQGRFTFNNLPDGDWYVVTKVTWGAVSGGRYSYVATQGGFLMQKVSVRGGQTKDVVLTTS